MAIKINSKELEQVLTMTPAEQNIMLVGKHGIGKSEILTKYFTSKGMKVVTLFLGQMSDPGDLIGLPQKDESTGKTDFMPPYWFPTDGQPVVLFLDELNRARPEVLQTIMDLALNRKLAGRNLPDGSRIISAVNDGEEYQLTDLDPALVSRFNVYEFRPTVEEWLLWASTNGIDERIIAFIQENPKMLDESLDRRLDQGLEKSPDRRAWTKVSAIISAEKALKGIHKKAVSGIVGMQAATAFFNSFAENRIIDARELLLRYSKNKSTIMAYKLHELAILNESVFRFFESADLSVLDKAKIAANLESYLNDQQKGGRRECIAHFASLYGSGSYPQSVIFILQNARTVYRMIQDFIQNL